MAFQVLGQDLEGWLVSGLIVWCFAALLASSHGMTRYPAGDDAGLLFPRLAPYAESRHAAVGVDAQSHVRRRADIAQLLLEHVLGVGAQLGLRQQFAPGQGRGVEPVD